MKSLKTIFFLALLFSLASPASPANSSEHWTYFFYINGDYFYDGPTLNKETVVIEDQAEVIYEQARELAKNDSQNNYVIFYDPVGKKRPHRVIQDYREDKPTKIRIYEKGERVYFNFFRFTDLDSTAPKTFATLRDLAIEEMHGTYKSSRKLLYFYGEHFPVSGEVTYTLDDEAQFGLKDFLGGLEELTRHEGKHEGKLDMILMHTCYMNTLKFLSPTLDYTERVLVPERAVLNTPLNLRSLKKASNLKRRELAERIKKDNGENPKYTYLHYGGEVQELSREMKKLESSTYAEAFNRERYREDPRDYLSWADQISQNPIILNTGELIIPFFDYFTLIDQYLKTNQEQLFRVEKVLSENPGLINLYDVIRPLDAKSFE